MLETLFEKKETSLPPIKTEYIYNINKKDCIFNSLRSDYIGFEEWLKKSSKEHTKSWIVKPSNKLEAICIYKEAKEDDYAQYQLLRKALKLATFKVDEAYRGKKFGELMLKQAFLYAVKNNYQSCWMTVFPRYEVLINFIKDFGFVKIGKTNRKDKKK